jgi:hypothetical protein
MNAIIIILIQLALINQMVDATLYDWSIIAKTGNCTNCHGGSLIWTFNTDAISKITRSACYKNTLGYYTFSQSQLFELSGYEVPTIYTTSTNAAALMSVCPFVFTKTDYHSDNNKIWIDSISVPGITIKKQWDLKPWGIPTIIAATIRLEIKTGNCEHCGGTHFKVTRVTNWCGSVGGIAEFSCSDEIHTVIYTSQLNKNSEWDESYHEVGGFDVGLGFVHHLIGYKIETQGTDGVGIHSMKVKDLFGITHCSMSSACTQDSTDPTCFFFMDSNTMFLPCITPVVNITPLPDPLTVAVIAASTISAMFVDCPEANPCA